MTPLLRLLCEQLAEAGLNTGGARRLRETLFTGRTAESTKSRKFVRNGFMTAVLTAHVR
jgi:hypothetical protein